MRIVRLFFPGDYEDALVYMGRLLLFTSGRTVETVSLPDLTEGLKNKFIDSHFAITLAVLRNDWLQSPQFLEMINDLRLAAAVEKQFDSLTQSPIEVIQNKKSVQDLNVQSRALFDFLLYYQRLYIAADDGFYHLDGDWDNTAPTLGPSVKRTDASSFGVSARLGTVNVSCGEDGLFSAFDDFSWVRSRSEQLEKSADASIRTSWVGFNLVNYRTARDVEVLLAHRESNPMREGDKRVITSFSSRRAGVSEILSSKEVSKQDDLNSAYFFDHQGFEQDARGRITSIQLTAPRREGYVPREKSRRVLNTPGDRVLSLSICSVGPVLETKNNVALCTVDGSWTILLAERVLNVRTFKDSKHYQNLVCITTEHGVHIMSCVELGLTKLGQDSSSEKDHDGDLTFKGEKGAERQRFDFRNKSE
jgi:hypothetical protein